MSERSGQVSELLQQWIQGDQDALGAVVIAELPVASDDELVAWDERDWATARIWLRREMSRAGSP